MSHRVLVVDDDEIVRMNLALVLRMEGYDVSTAASGKVALDLVDEIRPNAIVLDISMPGMNGWETLARIREKVGGRDAPVIALTGDRVDAATCRRAGFNGYLAKGGSLDRFLEMLRSAVDHRSTEMAAVWIAETDGAVPSARRVVSPASTPTSPVTN